MKHFWLLAIVASLIFGGADTSTAQSSGTSPDNLWTSLDQLPSARGGQVWVQPEKFSAFSLNQAELQKRLLKVPREFSRGADRLAPEITVPRPDGQYETFSLVESPVMADGLAERFPTIKTFLGKSTDRPGVTIRADTTPAGFHAQVFSPEGMYYVDPYFRNDTSLYTSYRKGELNRAEKQFQCYVEGEMKQAASQQQLVRKTQRRSNGATLRTYRAAFAAQGEYTAFHGGTVTGALAGIVTTLNRVTGVYERDLSVRFLLVTNNDQIIFTDPVTDPYPTNDCYENLILDTNKWVCDTIIGNANYDVGHVFNTSGGGLAGQGVCTTYKSDGCTGSSTPMGDPFDVDYVCHELGHQFSASHTFNGTADKCSGNGYGPTAYEPGSGSTILAYAGICGADNLQANSDAFFHSESLEQILTYVENTALCSSNLLTGNTIPTVVVGPDVSIPKGTPFLLVAEGSDSDGDSLTYSWEQRDKGPPALLSAPDNGSSPLHRAMPPSSNNWRLLPRLTNLLNNTTGEDEKLPSLSRIMNYRCVIRDNRSNGGGINSDDISITVDESTGPFLVTVPNTAVTLSGNRAVVWDPAGTTGGSVTATTVNILLSLDGGVNFTTVLATNTPNDGGEFVVLPSINNSSARIKVEGNGNIFFDISNVDFTIEPPGPVTNQPPVVYAGPDQDLLVPASNAAMMATVTDDSLPSGVTNVAWSKQSGPGTVNFTPSANIEDPSATFSSTGTYVLLLVSDDGVYTNSDTVTISYTSNNLPTLAEALDKTDVTWFTGGSGSSNWYPTTNGTHDGVDAGQSADNVDDLETNWVQTTVTGPGTLSFWWKVSSEADYDYLRLRVNGSSIAAISGESGWLQVITNLTAGSKTLRWVFERDELVGEGQDAGWLDEVVFTSSINTNYRPAITSGYNNGSLTIDFDTNDLPDWIAFSETITNWPPTQRSPAAGDNWTDTNLPAPPKRFFRFLQDL